MSSSTYPTSVSGHPLAPNEWTPEALAKRVFVLALIGLVCVGLAFVLVGFAGSSF